MSDGSSARRRQAYFRVCDSRYPFLWVTAAQPPARWHGPGEGPVAYLSTSAAGAWAEFLRHEGITEVDQLADVERALWSVDGPTGLDEPALDRATLTGDETTYPACRAEARRLRSRGSKGLRAPSAALRSGTSDCYGVDTGGVWRVSGEDTWSVAVFPDADRFHQLTGRPLCEGRPEPAVLGAVRYR